MLRQSSLLTAALFALHAQICLAAEPISHTQRPRILVVSVDLIPRAESALLQYARGCATSNAAGSDSLTDNAVIEYATAKTGRFLAVDAAYMDVCWEGATQMNRARDSHIRLYPTNYPNTVFAQFETEDVPGVAREHLCLIEIDGKRIARIRDLTTIK
jgi:hypothetical protein